MTNPLVLELIRQSLRWLGVWAMTIGVPENIANLTTREDTVVGVAGFIAYALAETGWLASKWMQFRAWVARKRAKTQDATVAEAVLEIDPLDLSKGDAVKVEKIVKKAVKK